MTGARRRGSPDPDALGAVTGGGLRKAADVDPVLGVTGGGSPQERAARPVTTVVPARPDPTVPAATPAAPVGPPAKPARRKEQWHDDAGELALLRAAYLHTHAAEGHLSWSAFVADVMRRERHRLEVLYNGGRPWPPAGVGSLPTGRPLGS